MIKKHVKIFLLFATTFAFQANADIALKDNSELIGKWNLYAEAAKIDGEKKAVKVEWEFEKDGTLQTTSTDSVGRTKEMKIAIKYFIENGEIKKQTTPGREKYESCKVVEKHDSKMVLKCTYLFFFLTKI
ncbi:MAG: hypothetical protein ACXW1W_03380 [Methylococcaceae bacterium]